MMYDALLPVELWPETTKAAAHLYNMSPPAKNGFQSPNEVLARWYETDLRLNNRRCWQGGGMQLQGNGCLWGHGML